MIKEGSNFIGLNSTDPNSWNTFFLMALIFKYDQITALDRGIIINHSQY